MKSRTSRLSPLVPALIIGLALLLNIGGCSDSSSGPSDKPTDERTVIDKTSATVTSAGATLTLQNGMALQVPAGAVSGSVKVDLTQIEDTLFNASNQTLLKISMDGAISEAALRVPIGVGQSPDLCGSAYVTNGGETLTRLDDTVSAGNDTLIVSLGSGGLLSAASTTRHGSVKGGEYVLEMGGPVETASLKRIIPIPYYEQDGGNCWAAASLALMKSYQNNFAFDEIYELCHALDIGKDEGIVWHDMDRLGDKLKLSLGLEPEIHSWVFYESFKNYIITQVDAGIPVMVNMLKHQGVFIGYEIENPGPAQELYLIYHDPQNSAPQTAYRKVSLQALQDQYWNGTVREMLWNYFTTLHFKVPPTAPRLQTIHLLDADQLSDVPALFQKGLGFARNNRMIERAVWDHTQPSGLLYPESGGEIPRDFTGLILRASPVWNMDLEDAAAVRIKTSLYRIQAGVFKEPALKVIDATQSIGAKSVYRYAADISVADFADKLRSPDTLFAMEVEIFGDDGSRLDAFDVRYRHHPLRIFSVDPSSGQVGDWVTVHGVGFGRTTSQITFGGTPATGVSVWNDSLIVVRVPASATSGGVVVTVGQYSSNAVHFATTGLLDQVKRSKFEQLNAFGVFNTRATRMFGLFWPAKNNERNLVWNGRVATKSYVEAFDNLVETMNLRIVFSSDALMIDSITGYHRLDQMREGYLFDSTVTELGAIDLPFQYSRDDEDGFFCWYVLEKEEIAPKLTKLSWRRTSYYSDGRVSNSDSLTSVDWLDPNHDGEVKLLLWERMPN